jgi:regulator of sigma E protease
VFTTLISFLFVLGVLIFVHELGHFLMARRIGVRVLTFSLGFGPKLLKVTRGSTEYCVSAIPLGGYVKMAGENPEEARTGAADEFLSKGKWQRFQVLVMGPVMNLALAVIVMAVVLYQGAPRPLYERHAVIVGAFADGSTAALAGLKLGDRVVTVDGEPVENWDQYLAAIVPKAKREITLGIVRNGRPSQLTVVPASQGEYELGDLGIQPIVHPEVAAISQGQAAEAAGLKTGDVIMEVEGKPDLPYDQLIAAIRSHEDKPLRLTVQRGTELQEITVTPRLTGDKAMIGAQFNFFETYSVKPGPIEAVKLSIQKNWEWTKQIGQTLGGLFTHSTSVKQLMGPVAIARLSGSAAKAGWLSLFTLLAMISLNLGLLNLMPIPVLDGGHITILALEGLARRDFSMKVKEKMLGAGFVLLVMLMLTVIFNDLMRIPWILKLVQSAS